MSRPTLRLFLAIGLSAEVRQALAALQANLKPQLPTGIVRWTDPDGVHLTLKFLGETPEDRVPAIADGLAAAAAGFQPFELRVAGLGCFPNPGRARVLWVGVADAPKALAGVQRAIDLHMGRLNFPRETRPFHPHLTLGRVNDRVSAVERRALGDLLSKPHSDDLGRMPVGEIVLFQSNLRPGGAVYTALVRSRLGNGIDG